MGSQVTSVEALLAANSEKAVKPCPMTVKVSKVTPASTMGSLKVATTWAFADVTLLAPLAGAMFVTTGPAARKQTFRVGSQKAAGFCAWQSASVEQFEPKPLHPAAPSAAETTSKA